MLERFRYHFQFFKSNMKELWFISMIKMDCQGGISVRSMRDNTCFHRPMKNTSLHQKLYFKTKHLMAVLNLPCHQSIWLTFQFMMYHLSGIWWDATFLDENFYFEWNVTNNDTLVLTQWFSTFYYMRLLLLKNSHKTQIVIQYKTVEHKNG